MKTKISVIILVVISIMMNSMALVISQKNDSSNEIYISPYKLYLEDSTKVTSNRTFSATQWGPKYLSLSSTGGYEGAYFTLEDAQAYVNVLVDTLNSGIYDVYAYIPGGTLTSANHTANCNISITGKDNTTLTGYNMSDKPLGEFSLLAQDVEIEDNLVIRYTCGVAKPPMRIDVIKLVLKNQDKPTLPPTESPEPTESTMPTIPPEPAGSAAPTVSAVVTMPPTDPNVQVKNVQIKGERVEAEGLEGLGVDGTCDITYEYMSSNNTLEDKANVKVQWYKSLLEDGEYTPIENANALTYKIPVELGGYYLKAGIIAKDIHGIESNEMFTEALQVKYKLAFSDDFNYEAASGEDPEFIAHGWSSDRSIRVLGSPTVYCARVPENISVSDGKLKIVTRKEHLDRYTPIDYAGHPHTWTSGQVFTSTPYGPYGVYDASYKLTKATGLNQSFWCMVRNAQTVANGFIEMDFNEGHYPFEMATNLHRGTGTGTVTAQNSIKHYPLGKIEGVSETLADNFNRYTGMLKPNNDNYTWDASQNSDTYQVYFNNSLQRKTRSLPYVPNPVSIFFSVAVYPGTFTGPLVEQDADGSVMEADWVRYYEFLGTTKADLEREIQRAKSYKDNAVIGTANGNYSQDSVDAISQAILDAENILNDVYDVNAFTEALTDLKGAINVFLRSVVGGYYVHIETISFDEKNIDMLVEKTKQLTLRVFPEDSNDQTVTYSSSNNGIAKVDKDGLVTAISAGTVVITATAKDGGIQTQCTVSVRDLPENQVFYPVTGGKLIFDKNSKSIIDYVGSPTEIVIPSRIDNIKVEQIAINTFKNLTTLKILKIKRGLLSIGDWSFLGCTSLASIELPDSLISINTAAFQDCDALTEITIPSSVANLEDGAFSLCDNLKKAVFNGNAPAEVQRVVFGENEDFAVYFYTGAEGFTTPTWNGYKTIPLEGTPIPIPEPVLTKVELTGGRNTAVKSFTLKPFIAKAYDEIGDQITDIDFDWTVEGKATVKNGVVTISDAAVKGDIVKVTATGTYNNKTMSATREVLIADSLLFEFGNKYQKIKEFLPAPLEEKEISDTGITTTIKESKYYSNVEIMNVNTKTNSGYYPYQNGLPGTYYYLFISGRGTNVLKLPYTAKSGNIIRLNFAKPYSTNNGTKNRSAGNQMDVTVGNETYNVEANCAFDKWYTKDFHITQDTNTIVLSMGEWSSIAIKDIEIILNEEANPTFKPTEQPTLPTYTEIPSINGKKVIDYDFEGEQSDDLWGFSVNGKDFFAQQAIDKEENKWINFRGGNTTTSQGYSELKLPTSELGNVYQICFDLYHPLLENGDTFIRFTDDSKKDIFSLYMREGADAANIAGKMMRYGFNTTMGTNGSVSGGADNSAKMTNVQGTGNIGPNGIHYKVYSFMDFNLKKQTLIVQNIETKEYVLNISNVDIKNAQNLTTMIVGYGYNQNDYEGVYIDNLVVAGANNPKEAAIQSIDIDGSNVSAKFYSEKGVLIFAGYNAEDVLTQIHLVRKEDWMNSNGSYIVNQSMNGDFNRIKCFLWDDIDTMIPLCDSKSAQNKTGK